MTKEALAPSVTTHKDDKGRKFVSIVEAAYDKAKLTDEEAQRVNDTPGLSKLVGDFIAQNRVPNKYSDEETSSSYDYPKDFQYLPIEEQVAKLQELFPGLKTANLDIAKGELPEGAGGWVAIPRWDKLASTYNEAVLLALDKLGKSRKFYNYRDGELSEKYLRQNERTIQMWQTLCDQQPDCDILIVAVQWGKRHRGRSVRRARECFMANEFGLGIFATMAMLLVHPKRLQTWEQLHWDCAGDDYDWDADDQWTDCPDCRFGDDEVELDADGVDDVYQSFGSASAFLGSV